MKILPPERLFEKVRRDRIVNVFDKIYIEFDRPLNLEKVAERVREAEYMADWKSNGVKIKTKIGCIMVYRNSAQIPRIANLDAIPALSSYLYHIIHTDKPTSFIDWKQSLPWKEKGWLGDLIANLEKTVDDVKKIVRR